MAASNMKDCIACDIHKVWKVENDTWRRDFSKTEAISSLWNIPKRAIPLPLQLQSTINVGHLTWKTAIGKDNGFFQRG